MAGREEEPRNGPDQVLPATSLKCWAASGTVQLQMTSSGPASQAPVSVHSFIRSVVERRGDLPALAVKRDGQWRYWNYEEYFSESRTVAKAFIKLGLERFHGVCIMGFNSPEWLIANFGAVFAGGMTVGVYTSNSPEVCRHLASDSQAQIIVLENEVYVQKFLAVKQFLPNIKAIIQWSGTPTTDGVLSWQELLAVGNSETDDALEERLRLQAVNQCCTIIYTSGTTGPPKGVMCSQDNLTYTTLSYSKIYNPQWLSHRSISYLPMSHIAGLMSDGYGAISGGSVVYFADHDALKGSLGRTIREVQPSTLFGVPRVWEKMYDKIKEVEREAGPAARRLLSWAKYHAYNSNMALHEGRPLTSYQHLMLWLARRLVLSKVKEAIGAGQTQRMVCGSAPLSPIVARHFLSLDLPVMDCYGLSETFGSGTTSLSEAGGCKMGSVGKALPVIGMKLLETSPGSGDAIGREVCFRGRSIFMGYLNMPDNTNATIQDDGWMLTGDLGWLDSDGFLFISGRLKELVITAGGENIPPVVIEAAIKKQLPILANAMLIGDKRKFLSILLTIKCDFDDVTGMPLDALAAPVLAWCSKRGVKATTVTEFRREVDTNRDGVIGKAVQAAIDRYNANSAISNAQKVQRWTFLAHDFSLATGELNNTLKLKRSVAATMFADIIDQMYSDNYPAVAPKSKL